MGRRGRGRTPRRLRLLFSGLLRKAQLSRTGAPTLEECPASGKSYNRTKKAPTVTSRGPETMVLEERDLVSSEGIFQLSKNQAGSQGEGKAGQDPGGLAGIQSAKTANLFDAELRRGMSRTDLLVQC